MLVRTALQRKGDRQIHPCSQLLEFRREIVGWRERTTLPEQDVVKSLFEVHMSQRLLSVRNSRSAPVIDLFDQGLSFRLMLSWGMLPPLETMNEFLACGRDDTDAEDGLVEWDPVALTRPEYAQLLSDLKKRGYQVKLDTVPPGSRSPSYESWFASHLAERAPKARTRKRPQGH